MEPQYISYQETGCFSPTIIRYLEQDEALKPFIAEFPSINAFDKITKEKTVNANRRLLVEILSNQYQSLENHSEKLNANIASLLQKNTFTITTGHQLNIFTGPLYFIFKIVTAIKLAEDLKEKFPDYNFVPVYWMASEDHDFEEINHSNLGGKTLKWDLITSGATGRINTKTIKNTLKEYTQILGSSLNADNLSQIINEAYTQFENLSKATRYLVNQLFGQYGLVVLDADDKELKRAFSPIIQQDIIGQNSFKLISESDEKLAEIGIDLQAAPREINFFYLKDALRERIVFEEKQYKINNTDIIFSADELITEIKNHPDRFSPNVVMRPLYQETILPNIAYIGGAAEVTYWMQLKSTFDFYGVDFPLVMLRNSAMLIPEKVQHKLQKLKLRTLDIFTETSTLKKAWVMANTNHNLNLNEEWESMNQIFEQLKQRIATIDATLSPSTEAVKVRLYKALQNLEKKILKAEKRNFTEAIADIDKIKQLLFPFNQLQERTENFGLFYVKYGDEFISELIKAFKPLDFKFTILQQ